MFVIFDLDGTLADCSHRMHHIREVKNAAGDSVFEREPDWAEFYLSCVDDKPIWPMINTLRAFAAGGASIEIWTGRSDMVRDHTIEWFGRFGVPSVPMLMRTNGDHSNDVELKQRWFVQRGQKPDLVFEDRKRVVEMWRVHDVFCAQVAPGDF